MAHKWAGWLHKPCRLGGPPRFRAGDKIRGGHNWAGWLHNCYRLQVPNASERGTTSKVAHKWAAWLHNRYRLGSLTLQSGGQHQRWPTTGPVCYINAAASGVPNTSERGTTSEVAHKWVGWLHKPCRLGPNASERGPPNPPQGAPPPPHPIPHTGVFQAKPWFSIQQSGQA